MSLKIRFLLCSILILSVWTSGCATKAVGEIGRINGKMAIPEAYQTDSGEIWVYLKPDPSTGTYIYNIDPGSCKKPEYEAASIWIKIPEDYIEQCNRYINYAEISKFNPVTKNAAPFPVVSINDFENEVGKYIIYRESLGDYRHPAY